MLEQRHVCGVGKKLKIRSLTKTLSCISNAWHTHSATSKHLEALALMVIQRQEKSHLSRCMEGWRRLSHEESILRNKALKLVSHSLQRTQKQAHVAHHLNVLRSRVSRPGSSLSDVSDIDRISRPDSQMSNVSDTGSIHETQVSSQNFDNRFF